MTTDRMSERTGSSVDALVERGERDGSVRESEIEQLIEEQALSSAQTEELRERLAERGVTVEDDCGRPAAPVRYANGELAHYTVDALEQFLAEAARHRQLTAAEEIQLAKRIERGDLAAKEGWSRTASGWWCMSPGGTRAPGCR